MEYRDIISEEEQERIINACQDLGTKALFGLLYISGARISELCNSYIRENIRNDKKELIEIRYVGNRCGLLAKDIVVSGRDVSITLPIRKKRSKVKSEHTLVFDINTPYMDVILEHAETKSPEEPLFDISTRTAQRYIKKIDSDLKLNGVICKLFRNTRLTKIAKLATTEEEIKQWAGHADTRSLSRYIAMKPITSFKRMIR